MHIVTQHPDWLQPVLSPWLSVSPRSRQLTSPPSSTVRTTCLLFARRGGRRQLYKVGVVAGLQEGLTVGTDKQLTRCLRVSPPHPVVARPAAGLLPVAQAHFSPSRPPCVCGQAPSTYDFSPLYSSSRCPLLPQDLPTTALTPSERQRGRTATWGSFGPSTLQDASLDWRWDPRGHRDSLVDNIMCR